MILSDFSKRREAMVNCQVRPSDVTKFPIISAMLDIPREDFVPAIRRELAYLGDHIAIGPNRVILDPRVLAKMLDVLDIRNNELVLDIGSAFGYSAAIIARMAEVVVALEELKVFSSESEMLLAQQSVYNVVAITGQLVTGAPQHGPYDVITIQGGIERLPEKIADQLKDGGRIAAIVTKGAVGKCQVGIKQAGNIIWRMDFDASAPVLPGFEAKREFIL